MADSVLSFSRIAGGANCKGPMYEIKAAAMLYLRGLNSGRAFQLATNVKGAGALDDIVFRFKMADRWRTLFVQLKHKEAVPAQLRVKDFKASEGVFSLVKYFKSYLEICLAIKANGEQVASLFDGKLKYSLFVIFTNAGATDDLKKKMLSVNDDSEIIKEYLGFGVGLMFRFDLKSYPDLVDILQRQWEEIAKNEKYEHREAIAQLDCNTEIVMFMLRLRIFCGQPSESGLDSIIIRELGEMRDCAGLSNKLGRLSECFIEHIQKWAEKKGHSDILHEGSDIFLRTRGKVIVETVTSVEEKACLLNVTFEPSVLVEWEEAIKTFRLIRVESSESSSRLTCTKLVQAIGSSYMVLGLEALMKNQESVLSECQYGDHRVVVIVSNLDLESSYFDIVKNVCNIAINFNKQIIIVDHTARLLPEHISQWKSITDTFKLSQIDEGSRNNFLATKLHLQGMEVSLNQLIDGSSEDANAVLSASFFVEFMKSGTIIEIGSNLTSNVENYVPRTLKRAISFKFSIFKGTAENMIILNSSLDDVIRSMFLPYSTSSLSLHKTEETLNKYRKVTKITAANNDKILDGETFHLGDFECNFVLLQKRPVYEALALRCRPRFDTPNKSTLLGWVIFVFKGISEDHIECLQTSQGSKHLLSFKDTELHWLKSEGQIETIRKHIDDDKLLSYDLSTSEDVSDRLVLVCAEPGMGKTSLMSQIATETKKNLPHCWVIFLSLNDHTKLLSKEKHTEIFEFLTAASVKGTEFQKAIFRHALEVTGNVVVILDGVDEIAPKYVEQSEILISNLLKTRIKKVLVTSRNSMKRKLEDNLKTLAVSIQKFNQVEQISFLIMSWETIKKISEEELKEFITILLKKASRDLGDREQHFLGTPLQLVIMAGVFEDHVTHSTGTLALPGKLDLLKMMKEFINKKLDIYVQKKRLIPRHDTYYEEEFELHRDRIFKTHVNAALFSIIDEENLSRLQDKEIKLKALNFLHYILSLKEKTGIIDSVVNDKPRFIHRVFAEYFAATWFAEHFAENTGFLEENLHDASFGGIRTFFDRLLAEKCDLHTAVLNEDVEKVRAELLAKVNVNSKDYGDRTALHLAASFVPSKDKLETARAIGILNLLIDSKPDFSLTDKVLNMSPLQYADMSQSWTAINKLLPHYNIADNQIWLCKTVVNLQNKEMFDHIVTHDLDWLLKFCQGKGLVVDKKEYNERDEDLLMRLMENGSHFVMSLLGGIENKAVAVIPLHYAAGRGDFVAVERIIENAKATMLDDAIVRDFVNARDERGQPSLYYAALHGHAQVLSLLIEQGAEIEYKHDHVGILLSSVASFGHVDVIRVLLDSVTDKSAFIMACSEDGHTALQAAASGGHASVATLLLAHLDADEKSVSISANSFRCSSALLIACYWGRHDVVRVFLEALGDAEKAVYANTNYDDAPIHLVTAVSNGHMETVDILLANLNEPVKSDYIQGVRKAAFLVAAHEGHCDIVRRQLASVDVAKRKYLITCSDEKGKTAFHNAATKGFLNVLHVLLEALDELDATVRAECVMARDSTGVTALLLAAYFGHAEFVKYLLETVDAPDKAAYIFSRSGQSHSALLAASRNGHAHTVEAILDALDADEKADYFANQKFFGSTDLHVASASGHVDVIKVLLKKVDAHQKTDYVRTACGKGQTALHLAVLLNHINAVDALLEELDPTLRGECINALDDAGTTVVHYAALTGTVEMVKQLVEAGGSLLVTNHKGCTPLMEASMKRRVEMAVYLLSSFIPEREGVSREEYLSMTDVNGKGALDCGEEIFNALLGCLWG